MLVGCNSRFGRVGGAGQGAESAASGGDAGEDRQKETSQPSVRAQRPEKREGAGNGDKEHHWRCELRQGLGESRGRALQGPGTGAETWGCPEQWEALPWGSAGLSGVRKSFCV